MSALHVCLISLSLTSDRIFLGRYNRNWRYHKDLHLWLTKEQNTEPTQKTPTFERGNYVFFDPGPWEKITKSESHLKRTA